MKRQERIERVRAVEREQLAARFSSKQLKTALASDPSILVEESFGLRDVRKFEENLDATYLVRMFAEFEAGLRDVWANYIERSTQPPAKDLIESIGTHRLVPDDVLDGVGSVREYRNSMVHEGMENAPFVAFEAARSFLGKFLSRLPLDWKVNDESN